MIALEREASLRVESGSRVEIVCVSGVLWVTHEGDARDLFLARGESLVPPAHGVTMVTALESATVRVLDYSAPKITVSTWSTRWIDAMRNLLLLRRGAYRAAAVVKPRNAAAG